MGGLILARMRCFAMYQLGGIVGTGLALPGPAASPLHDALNAVAAAAHAAITGCVGHPRCQCPKSRAWLSWAFAEVCRGVRVGSWY